MIGWPLEEKCLLACRLGEESQQPPHVRHSRKCTQGEPMIKQSSQPSALGVTGRIALTCGSVNIVLLAGLWNSISSTRSSVLVSQSSSDISTATSNFE